MPDQRINVVAALNSAACACDVEKIEESRKAAEAKDEAKAKSESSCHCYSYCY